MTFCVHIWIFHALSIKISFKEIATDPHTHAGGAAKSEFCASVDIYCNVQHYSNKKFIW